MAPTKILKDNLNKWLDKLINKPKREKNTNYKNTQDKRDVAHFQTNRSTKKEPGDQ